MAEAWLMVRLGFAAPDKSIYHLLVDEAQDYSETALALLSLYHPNAHVTLLGDPMQRTCPGMERLRAGQLGRLFRRSGRKGVFPQPLLSLHAAHRPPLQRHSSGRGALKALWPGGRHAGGRARTASKPCRRRWRGFRKAGQRSIAVVTRTQKQAEKLCEKLPNVYRFDGGEDDWQYENGDTVVGCYHL